MIKRDRRHTAERAATRTGAGVDKRPAYVEIGQQAREGGITAKADDGVQVDIRIARQVSVDHLREVRPGAEFIERQPVVVTGRVFHVHGEVAFEVRWRGRVILYLKLQKCQAPRGIETGSRDIHVHLQFVCRRSQTLRWANH